MTWATAEQVPSNSIQPSLEVIDSGEENSISSTISEAGSSDSDMDMDSSNPNPSRIAYSYSPEQFTSSWVLRSTPLRVPRMALNDQGNRVPTPIVAAPTRPQSGSASLPPASRNHLGYAMERFPSPISEDEPHTPTTAAGSQFSLLTVTDVDMDLDAERPSDPVEPPTVRKQRQRSGAFTSPREPTKKFTMGYRDDCDKCRNRVPGHMNHFLGS